MEQSQALIEQSLENTARIQSLTVQVAELTTRLEKINELPSTMVLDSEHHVSELVLEKEDDDSYSLFPTNLVESEEEEAEISISPLLESSTTDFGFISDMVPINTDTPSLELSMGESEFSSILQETSPPKCEYSTLEANIVDSSLFGSNLEYEDPDFMGVKKFLEFGCFEDE
ncbi:hypothetical protein COLO4_25089 [Corchorus olitorius]|uniref:Uncharacterized protein n=1 Tax=Corchorus olitorius TaxID=93759 RepID=A0A1R3I4M4_9ROSI|nr:hypothetical protein COLO4_25089 [Corchorus olitorius]